MRKLFISTSVALALGLSGCGGSGESMDEIQADTPVPNAILPCFIRPGRRQFECTERLTYVTGR